MEKKDKRKKILRISGLIGLFLLVFGLSYALFTVTLNGTKKVKVKTGKLELQLLDENNQDITDSNNAGYSIDLDNQVPVSDEEGLSQEGFTFKLKNIGTIDARYTIYLDDVELKEGEDRLPDSAVRYLLTKNGSSDNAQDLTTIGVNPNRKLDEGIIKKDVTNTYTLKIWIDEEAGNEAMDKVFATTLRVYGVQYVAPNYGEEIISRQLTPTINATYYYKAEENIGYNNSKVTRMSNVRRLDNEEIYEGGTLVISGTGELPGWDYENRSYPIAEMLADVNSYSELTSNDGFSSVNIKYHPKYVIIGEGITKIGRESFVGMNTITNVSFPNSLREIESYAFNNCSLTEVVLPYGLEEMGAGAFAYNNIHSINIPATLKNVEDGTVIYGNEELINIKYEEGCTTFWPDFGELGESISYLPASINKVITKEDVTDRGNKESDAKIYCETQEVFNLVKSNSNYYTIRGSEIDVVLDPIKFE